MVDCPIFSACGIDDKAAMLCVLQYPKYDKERKEFVNKLTVNAIASLFESRKMAITCFAVVNVRRFIEVNGIGSVFSTLPSYNTPSSG